MRKLLYRVEYLSRTQGVRRAARITAGTVYDWTRNRLVKRRRDAAQSEQQADSDMGIDTCGAMWPGEMRDVQSSNLKSAVRYMPTPFDDFRKLLKGFPVPLDEYSFIDYGSGKGRTLLLASEFPFKDVTGLEFSKDLHTTAVSNIAGFSASKQKCHNVQSICIDAVEYDLPAVPQLLYFFLPFDQVVMAKVLKGIEASLQAHPRPMSIVFYNLAYKSLLDGSKFLTEMHCDEDYAVYASAAAVPSYSGRAFSCLN